jgi:hypothetical protein
MCLICDDKTRDSEYVDHDTRFLECCPEVELLDPERYPNITGLQISNNDKINEIPTFDLLGALILTHSLVANIAQQPSLQSLMVRHCPYIQELPNFPVIVEITCTDTGLQRVPNCPTLRTLDVSDSPVQIIPSLNALTDLYCENTLVRRLERLPSLRYLNCTASLIVQFNNNFGAVPPTIVASNCRFLRQSDVPIDQYDGCLLLDKRFIEKMRSLVVRRLTRKDAKTVKSLEEMFSEEKAPVGKIPKDAFENILSFLPAGQRHKEIGYKPKPKRR